MGSGDTIREARDRIEEFVPEPADVLEVWDALVGEAVAKDKQIEELHETIRVLHQKLREKDDRAAALRDEDEPLCVYCDHGDPCPYHLPAQPVEEQR